MTPAEITTFPYLKTDFNNENKRGRKHGRVNWYCKSEK